MKIFTHLIIIILLFSTNLFPNGDLKKIEAEARDKKYSRYWDRLDAISALGNIGTIETAKILVDIIDDKEKPIQNCVVMSLGTMKNKETLKWLAETALSNAKSEIVKVNIIWSLAIAKDPQTLPFLLKAATDGNTKVREKTCLSLSKFNEKEILITLSSALKDSKPEVRVAALDSLRILNDKSVFDNIVKLIEDTNPEVKSAALETAGCIDFTSVREKILSALSHNDFRVRIGAVLGSFNTTIENAATVSAIAFKDKDYRVRSTTVAMLKNIWQPQVIELLIKQLEIENGRLILDIVTALEELTGESLGYSYKAWLQWWQTNQNSFEMPEKTKKKKGKKKDIDSGTTVFFNIPVLSERVYFIVDYSGSMREFDKNSPKQKIQIALDELKNTLDRLKDTAKVNFIVMNTEADNLGVRKFGKRLTPAVPKIKNALLEFATEAEEKLGRIRRGRGNMYDCLIEAFKDSEVDTIFVLSDGVPTYGDYIIYGDNKELATDIFIEAFSKENKFRRIVVHTILTGEKGTDYKFMQRLAESTGGIFNEKE